MNPAVPVDRPPNQTSPDVRSQLAGPVAENERISAIDAVRGFALLGILLMNIIPFAMNGAAYDDPTVIGGSTGPNLIVWAVLHVLAEGKMRCLFSLVFGTSTILLTSRLEASGRPAADIYYRRTIWLLLFGIADAYLLWLGDILYPYALCGFLLYPFRNMKAQGLLTIGSAFLVATSVAYVGSSYDTKEKIEQGRAAIGAETSGKKLTRDQRDDKQKYEDWLRFSHPDKDEIEKDRKRWTGTPFEVISRRAELVGEFHGKPYYSPMNWDIWSMMFIGMGLYKLGILAGKRSAGWYARLMLIGYGIGVPLNTWTAWEIIRRNFDPVAHDLFSSTYDLGRLSVAFGHLGLVMLLCRTNTMRSLMSRLAAIGQTALSNYILHSVICCIIFTGYGFRLYDTMQRYQVYYVVAAIWVVNLTVSPIWLKHYRFGPMEWAWRSLTYWKRQPFRRRTESGVDDGMQGERIPVVSA